MTFYYAGKTLFCIRIHVRWCGGKYISQSHVPGMEEIESEYAVVRLVGLQFRRLR